MTQPNARVTDAEKCKLIAERLEGWRTRGGAIDDGPYPEYMRCLDATMRAARNLPRGIIFEMTWGIEPLGSTDEERWIVEISKRNGDLLVHISHADPARAAFEALAAYLLT